MVIPQCMSEIQHVQDKFLYVMTYQTAVHRPLIISKLMVYIAVMPLNQLSSAQYNLTVAQTRPSSVTKISFRTNLLFIALLCTKRQTADWAQTAAYLFCGLPQTDQLHA